MFNVILSEHLQLWNLPLKCFEFEFDDFAVKDEMKPDEVSPANIVEEAALVAKAVEYIGLPEFLKVVGP